MEALPEKINIYNDNKFNINSLEALLSISDIEFNLLEKTDSHIKFRLDQDFFSFNYQNQDLIQYKDFKSLYEDSEGKIIHSFSNPANNDYGKFISDNLINQNFHKLPNKKLENVAEFKVNPSVRLGLSSTNFKTSQTFIDNFKNKINQSIQSQELRSINEIGSLLLTLSSLIFLFKIKVDDPNKNQELFKKIFSGLNNNTLKFDDLKNDKFLNREIPNLAKHLEDYQKENLLNFSLQKENPHTISSNELINNPQNTNTLHSELNKIHNSLEKTFPNTSPVLETSLQKEQMNPDDLTELKKIENFISKYQDKSNSFDFSVDEINAVKYLLCSKITLNENKKDKYFNESLNLIFNGGLKMDKIEGLFKKFSHSLSIKEDVRQEATSQIKMKI